MSTEDVRVGDRFECLTDGVQADGASVGDICEVAEVVRGRGSLRLMNTRTGRMLRDLWCPWDAPSSWRNLPRTEPSIEERRRALKVGEVFRDPELLCVGMTIEWPERPRYDSRLTGRSGDGWTHISPRASGICAVAWRDDDVREVGVRLVAHAPGVATPTPATPKDWLVEPAPLGPLRTPAPPRLTWKPHPDCALAERGLHDGTEKAPCFTCESLNSGKTAEEDEARRKAKDNRGRNPVPAYRPSPSGMGGTVGPVLSQRPRR